LVGFGDGGCSHKRLGCTIVYPSYEVGPSFRVKVEDQGQPVEGLRVQIRVAQSSANRFGITERSSANRFSITDKNGFALFRAVPPGSYHLSAAHDAGIRDGEGLEVKPNGPIDLPVALKWPSTAPVSVRFLKGTIRGPDYVPGQSQPSLAIELLESLSGRRLKEVHTNEKGEFNLEGTAPGRYFLSLKWEGIGLIAVTVNRDARADRMDLDVAMSSCGLGYFDRSNCQQGDLRTRQLSGRVVDTEGSIIPRARIQVLDPDGTLVEELQSDQEGEFDASRLLAGTYQLIVKGPGFTPYRRTVHVDSATEPSRRSAFTVQLGIFGSCSTNEVK
jgi:protocatechuate 3,4-dioxygenase beta subunit